MNPSRFSALRGAAVFAACGSLLALAAPSAMAATTTTGITGKISAPKGGTVAKPVGHSLFTQLTTTNTDGTQPPPVRTAVLTFGKDVDINGKAFKNCPKTLLDAMGPTACPAGSQVGKGSADGALGAVKLNLPVTAFSAGNGSKLELYVGGIVSKSIEGTIAGGKGKPKTITFSVPKDVINPVGGTFSSLTRFGVTIQGKANSGSKTVDYISTSGCTGNKIPLTAKTVYATKGEFPLLPAGLQSATPTGAATSSIACTN